MLPRAVTAYNRTDRSESVSETFVGMRIWRSRRALEQMRAIVDHHGVSLDSGILVPVSTRRLSATLGVTVGTVLAMYDRLGPIVVSRDPLVVDLGALELAEMMADPCSLAGQPGAAGDQSAPVLRVIRDRLEGDRAGVNRVGAGELPGDHGDAHLVGLDHVSTSARRPSSLTSETGVSDHSASFTNVSPLPTSSRDLVRDAPQVLVALGSERPELAGRCLELLGLVLETGGAGRSEPEAGSCRSDDQPLAARVHERRFARRFARRPAHRVARVARLKSESERERELSLSLERLTSRSEKPRGRPSDSSPRSRGGSRISGYESYDKTRDGGVDLKRPLVDFNRAEVLSVLRGLRGGIGQLDDRGFSALSHYTLEELASAVRRLNANPRARSPIGVMVAAALKGERLLFTPEEPPRSYVSTPIAAQVGVLPIQESDQPVAIDQLAGSCPPPAPPWATKAISQLDEMTLADLELRWSATLAGRLAAADRTLTDDEKLERLAIFFAATSGHNSESSLCL